MDIQKILDSIKAQVSAQQQDAIKKAVEKELQNFIIEEKNISPSLIQKFMSAKSDIKVPIPEKKEVPSAITTTDDISDLIQSKIGEIYTDLMVGNNVYLYGKAGTGKSVLAKKIAQVMDRNTQLINCNQFTSPINIIGGQTIEGYKQGQLVLAWERGEILILDELPKLDPNTAGLLNDALAQSADEDKTFEISKEKYEKLKKQMEDPIDEQGNYIDIDYDLKAEKGVYFMTKYITITDGKGDKIRKHKNFGVIGTGNTNLKDAPANFGGNNRQDYSLVDRFAGSMYVIDVNTALEERLIFPRVLQVCYQLRAYLDADSSSVESISLRTMLNFNRIYEQQGLRLIDSPLAVEPITENGVPIAKTLLQSLESFLDTLPETKKTDIVNTTNIIQLSKEGIDQREFISEFEKKYGINPITKKVV